MAETISVNGDDLSGQIPRDQVEWAESAYLGEVAEGRFVIHDDDGDIPVPGYKAVTVEQSSSTPSRIFTGYTGRKGISRGTTYNVGAGREIAVSTKDLNDLLGRHVIRDSTGNRSAETVSARVTWLLASGYLDAEDFGAVTYPTDVGLDATDYRGRFPGDVLADCAKAVRFNYYLRWSTADAAVELVFRDDNASTDDTCTLSISNVLADINSTTVFATQPAETELTQDPEHVYSGAYALVGKTNVYETRDATATEFADRDGITEDIGTQTAATATRDATTFLWESHTEEQMLPVVMRLRASKVGLVQVGQRISVRQTHMAPEGWDPARYARILRKRVTQPLNTDNDYDVRLDLSPQEDAPTVGSIIQSCFANGHGAGAYPRFANPVTIGSKLVFAVVDRDDTGNEPNTDPSKQTWGTDPWTEISLQEIDASPAPDTVRMFWKVADATDQECWIDASSVNVGCWELPSTADVASATVFDVELLTASTFAVGTIGDTDAGDVCLMAVGWYEEPSSEPGITYPAGWTQRWKKPAYTTFYTHHPWSWFGDSVGAQTGLVASISRGTAKQYAGIALRIPSV